MWQKARSRCARTASRGTLWVIDEPKENLRHIVAICRLRPTSELVSRTLCFRLSLDGEE
jgi:hypothetical protein